MLSAINNRYATERGLVRSTLAHMEFLAGRLSDMTTVNFEHVERLVFVCQGNICRSPFGEYIAKRAALPTGGFGLATTTGMPAFERAQMTAHKFDIDMSNHRTTSLEDFKIQSTDLLVAMEVRHARRLQVLAKPHGAQVTLLGYWASPKRIHIHDPFEHTEVYFENCFRVIKSGTENLVLAYKQSQ